MYLHVICIYSLTPPASNSGKRTMGPWPWPAQRPERRRPAAGRRPSGSLPGTFHRENRPGVKDYKPKYYLLTKLLVEPLEVGLLLPDRNRWPPTSGQKQIPFHCFHIPLASELPYSADLGYIKIENSCIPQRCKVDSKILNCYPPSLTASRCTHRFLTTIR